MRYVIQLPKSDKEFKMAAATKRSVHSVGFFRALNEQSTADFCIPKKKKRKVMKVLVVSTCDFNIGNQRRFALTRPGWPEGLNCPYIP